MILKEEKLSANKQCRYCLFINGFFVTRVICILRSFRRLGYWKLCSQIWLPALSLCLSCGCHHLLLFLWVIRHVLLPPLWPGQQILCKLFLEQTTGICIPTCAVCPVLIEFFLSGVCDLLWAFLLKFLSHGFLIFHSCLFDKRNTLLVSMARSSCLFGRNTWALTCSWKKLNTMALNYLQFLYNSLQKSISIYFTILLF